MKQQPIPRPRIFDLYWKFAYERQRIFERRVFGEPGAWTQDPILSTYKFCNTYRAADRVSQYLIAKVAYHGEPGRADDRLFQVVAFRLFSKIETWDAVRDFVGRTPTLDDLKSETFREGLEHAREVNHSIYTSAFILCANNAYGHSLKYLNHVELLRDMFLQNELGERLVEATSLAQVYTLLRSFPLIGDFMAYQIAIDLNYTDLLDFSENDFTQPGPGAVRGIGKVFETLGDYTPSEVILWMVDRQDREFAERGLQFKGLWGRPLHAIDCQGLFCETDKYCREAAPELASGRKRIKARYSPSSEPLTLFFPPKWHINSRLPQHLVLGQPVRGFVTQPALDL